MDTKLDIQNLKQHEISFGAGGISLLSPSDLEQTQNGYAFLENGTNLCGTQEGDWKKEWLVIGKNTLQGDPIFIDTSVSNYPVFTAPHGEGFWVPVLISSSYAGFIEILKLLKQLSIGREHPVGLSEYPMTQKEYDEFIESVRVLGNLENTFYWELLIEDEEEGIGPKI